MDTFTYITGIAGLLGLLLQLKDAFPEHRELRKTVVLLVIGVFVGSLVASVRSVKIDFGGSISPFTALIAVFVAVLVTVAISATFTQDASRRNDLFGFTAAGTLALFILLLFGVTGSEDSRAERQRRQLTIEELLELSNVHVSRNNFERAI
ncbi:MAG: hypothetical protein ACREJU_10980, partial [Nitrospiraceae bacterium]